MTERNLHAERAFQLMELRRFQEAISEWGLALSNDPTNDAFRFNQAVCLFNLGYLKQAKEILVTVQPLHLNEPSNVSYLLAHIHLREVKTFKKAEKDIQEAIKLANGQRANHFAFLSKIHSRNRKFRKAWDIVLQGLQIDPTDKDCLGQQLDLLQHVSPKAEKWQDVVQRALSIDPSNALFHAATGWLYWRKSAYEQAQQHFRTALEIDPSLNWAAEGMQETFKAENRLYRLYAPIYRVTRYLFMAILPSIGLIATNTLKTAHDTPSFRFPLSIFIGLITLLGLIPLTFNYFLWQHPIGRYTVTTSEKRNQINLAGFLLVVSMVMIAVIYLDIYGLLFQLF